MGHHLSKVPSAFQYGVEHENFRNVSGITSSAFDSQADKYLKYTLKHFACTVTFFGFLLLLSWYYGRSDLERGWDPVEAANEERDAAIEQRDDAQRTWQKTESKYEKTLATNLELRSRLAKETKDIPWLKQRLSELVKETNIQHEAIEDLEAIKRKYDKLSKQVNDYGLSAERPEHHQKRAEEFRRSLEASNNSLQTSQSYAKCLEERLQKQLETSNTEIKWLRTRLRRNARSTAYWARYRQHADDPGFKPAWGIRCACTEPDVGYSLRDQSPRIFELEDTVACLLGKILNTPDLETGVRAKAEEELAAKDTVIEELREEVTARNQTIKGLLDEKVTASDELAASRQKINELRGEKEAADRNSTTTISDLNHTLSEGRKDWADARQERADIQRELGQQKAKEQELRNAIAGKDVEISELERANQEMAEQPSLEAAENIRLLTIANTNLNELRRENVEYKEQSETQTAKISEWEATGRDFDARVEAKDDRIAKLEEKANEQSETHTTKLGEWEAAGRDLNARVEAKDHKIVDLESQIRSYNDAIYKKDKDYKELYDHYYIVLGEKNDVLDKYNGDVQTFNTMQKGYADREHELKRQWTEHTRSHVNCGGQVAALTKHVRELQGQLAELPSSEINFEQYRIEGENRARQICQANAAQEASAQRLRLKESEQKIFKLENELQQAKNQKNPLQEMQLKEREMAVKAKEDALKKSMDPMENDQQVSNSGGLELEDLERRLAAANQEIIYVKNRNRVVSGQLNTEKKERSEEKARHEKLLKQEQQNAKTKCDVLRITLEKEHPLKRVVSKLQDEVIRLRGEVEKRK